MLHRRHQHDLTSLPSVWSNSIRHFACPLLPPDSVTATQVATKRLTASTHTLSSPELSRAPKNRSKNNTPPSPRSLTLLQRWLLDTSSRYAAHLRTTSCTSSPSAEPAMLNTCYIMPVVHEQSNSPAETILRLLLPLNLWACSSFLAGEWDGWALVTLYALLSSQHRVWRAVLGPPLPAIANSPKGHWHTAEHPELADIGDKNGVTCNVPCPFELTKLNEQLAGKILRDCEAAKEAAIKANKPSPPPPIGDLHKTGSLHRARRLIRERGTSDLFSGNRLAGSCRPPWASSKASPSHSIGSRQQMLPLHITAATPEVSASALAGVGPFKMRAFARRTTITLPLSAAIPISRLSSGQSID